jgi:16S rRNA (cytosine1407-C5)-methyltransferase
VRSIGQVRQALPAAFLARLDEFFPPPIQERILAGFAADRPTTLRANTLKTDIRSLMQELSATGVKSDRVLWYPPALIVKNRREKDLAALPAYREGRLYLQSLSSMVPALMLAPRPGERILDLAAAPGSKTGQIAMMMENRGYILANDRNPVRLNRLRHNLRLQGVAIAETSLADGRALGRHHPAAFDRVLLDAPCSGEGLFSASNPSTYRRWSTTLVRQSAALQRRLVTSAFDALRPDGVLVYATCTLAPEENELLVDWALSAYAGRLETEALPLAIPGAVSPLVRIAGQELASGVARAIRLLPSRLFEGFFVCRFRKTG